MGADFEKLTSVFDNEFLSLTSSSSDEEMRMVEFLFPFPIEGQLWNRGLGTENLSQKSRFTESEENFGTLGDLDNGLGWV